MQAIIRFLLRVTCVLAIVLIVGLASTHQAKANSVGRLGLSIPSVGIHSKITEFNIVGGTWGIDPWERRIGHLEGTAWADGNIALGGHSRMPNGKPGIFAGLNQVQVGDTIKLNDGFGERQYNVTEIKIVPDTDISVVFPTSNERLTLITCDVNSFDEATGYYLQRLVVVAERMP